MEFTPTKSFFKIYYLFTNQQPLSISIYIDVETALFIPSTGLSKLQIPIELQKTHNFDSHATNADLSGDSTNLKTNIYKGLN